MSNHHHIRQILPLLLRKHFTPTLIDRHFKCAIGYGSGVFPQLHKPTQNTVDLILIVNNSKLFHEEFYQ